MRRRCRAGKPMPARRVLKPMKLGRVLALKQKRLLLGEGKPPNFMRVDPVIKTRGAIPNNEGKLSV